jgi:agmatinase
MDDSIHGDGAIRRQSLYGSSTENTYAGVLSFMRRRYTRDIEGADVVVSGVPLDLATTFRSGARFGPAAIRAASVQLCGDTAESKMFPWGFSPFKDLAVVDYGDCWLDSHNAATIVPAIVNHARTILSSGARMLTFGGDHFVSYPLIKAHVERSGEPLSLIHFDAHPDTWPDSHFESLNHGTMFYKAIKENLIDPSRSIQIGIRSWNDDLLGMNVLDSQWVHEHGVARTVQKIREVVGDHEAYLTFDVDCLDPAFAPGVGTPVPGGLSTIQALRIIRALSFVRLAGADVVEVAPAYDQSEITATAAAFVAGDLICLMRNLKVAGRL